MTQTKTTAQAGARTQFHIPTKPYSIIDAINRHAAATGSMRCAMLTEHGDYNGHSNRLSWNEYRGYYICEYQWAQRNVIVRTTNAREAIAASIREFNRQGRGASLSVSLREEDAHVAAEFPELVVGEQGIPAFHTWKYSEVCGAARWEQQLGVPARKFLIEATDEADYKAKIEEYCAARRRPPVYNPATDPVEQSLRMIAGRE